MAQYNVGYRIVPRPQRDRDALGIVVLAAVLVVLFLVFAVCVTEETVTPGKPTNATGEWREPAGATPAEPRTLGKEIH